MPMNFLIKDIVEVGENLRQLAQSQWKKQPNPSPPLYHLALNHKGVVVENVVQWFRHAALLEILNAVGIVLSLFEVEKQH